jgi:hypothetical protein
MTSELVSGPDYGPVQGDSPVPALGSPLLARRSQSHGLPRLSHMGDLGRLSESCARVSESRPLDLGDMVRLDIIHVNMVTV